MQEKIYSSNTLSQLITSSVQLPAPLLLLLLLLLLLSRFSRFQPCVTP